MTYVGGRKGRPNLSPLNVEFQAQQKTMEIQVHNDRLNVNTASSLNHSQSPQVLLIFCERFIHRSIGIRGQLVVHLDIWIAIQSLSLPSRVPTSHSVPVNRFSRG